MQKIDRFNSASAACVLADAGCAGGTPLGTFPDKFLNRTGELLICSTHGARFRVKDGICVEGPCQGAGLAPVRVQIFDGAVTISATVSARKSAQNTI